METKNQHSEEQHEHQANPHDHPQNASGRAGKEISQEGTHFDQSEENETLDQFKAELEQKHAQEDMQQDLKGEQNEREPVDRPIKDENGELK